jgi:hypothetical protein
MPIMKRKKVPMLIQSMFHQASLAMSTLVVLIVGRWEEGCRYIHAWPGVMLLLLVGIAPVDDTALETIMAGIWIRSRRMNVLIATSGNSVDVMIESGFASLNWVRVLGYLLEER